MEIKRCSRCNNLKPTTKFHRNSGTADGLRYLCKQCMKEYGYTYRENNKERIAQKKRRYRETNKAVIAKGERKWRETHKEHIALRNRKYRAANKEVIDRYTIDKLK